MALGFFPVEAMIPLDPECAREAEVDWGTAEAIIAGQKITIKIFCMRSRFSGRFYVQAYPGERQEMFFDGHRNAFDWFGGVFPVIVYDNLSTAVRKVFQGKRRLEQDTFVRFRAFYTFKAVFCNRGQGHEKGGVEGLVGYCRRNFLVPVPSVPDFATLNRRLLEHCLAEEGRVTAGRDDQRTIGEKHAEEKTRLLPLPAGNFNVQTPVPLTVSKYQTVRVDRNLYSVPTAYTRRKVTAELGCWTVHIHDGSKRIAEHPRCFGRGEWQLNPQHYLELIEQRIASFESARPIRQWRSRWPEIYEDLLVRLIHRDGESNGRREFVRILQLHRDYSASEVERAIRLAITCGTCGCDAVKHLLLSSTSSPAVWVPLPDHLIPGVTDRSVPPPDLTLYGALLEGGDC